MSGILILLRVEFYIYRRDGFLIIQNVSWICDETALVFVIVDDVVGVLNSGIYLCLVCIYVECRD